MPPGFAMEPSHPSSPAFYTRVRSGTNRNTDNPPPPLPHHHQNGLRASRSTKSSESFVSSPRAPVVKHKDFSDPAEQELNRLTPARIFTRHNQNKNSVGDDDMAGGVGGGGSHTARSRMNPIHVNRATQGNQHRRSSSNESSIPALTSAIDREHDHDSYLGAVDEDPLISNPNTEDLGPLLLRLATALHLSGDKDNSSKALECATRAAKFLEKATAISSASSSSMISSTSRFGKQGISSLDYVMSLHVLAAIYCRSGQYEEAIPILERAIAIATATPDIDEGGVDHALAAFAGYMQLGDILAMTGQYENALGFYRNGHQIQSKALGAMDPRVGETCSYLAEAYLKALQFQQAEEYCELALEIHAIHSRPGSLEEAADRRLMALILSGKGDHEMALEHLVLANAALRSHPGKDLDVAAVDCGIGDAYMSLLRFDEAIFSYQKALTLFKSVHGDSHTSVASVYVNLAVLYMKMRKHKESKSYCENALRIYGKPNAGHSPDELASGLTEIASVFESMNEREQALFLLQRSLDILEALPGQQSAVAGVEAQMGVLYYYLGRYEEAFMTFKSAVSKLRCGAEKRSPQLGIVLNQMGLACVGLNEIWHAADTFEESRRILEDVYGPHHAETLAVCSNLAGSYDALGRSDEAISLLEHILEVKEGRLGTVHPEVEEERNRLSELLKEAGRPRVRKTNTLEELLFISNAQSTRYQTQKNDQKTSVM